MTVPAQAKRAANSSFLYLFDAFKPLIYWMMPTCTGEGSLLNLPIQMIVSSRNTLTDICRNNVLSALWVFFGLVKLTHKINHLQH